jgi:hypothetical protein
MAEGKLRQVELDAMRIANKRFNEMFEEQEYQAQLKAEEEQKSEAVETNDESDDSDEKGK